MCVDDYHPIAHILDKGLLRYGLDVEKMECLRVYGEKDSSDPESYGCIILRESWYELERVDHVEDEWNEHTDDDEFLPLPVKAVVLKGSSTQQKYTEKYEAVGIYRMHPEPESVSHMDCKKSPDNLEFDARPDEVVELVGENRYDGDEGYNKEEG
jgi:hypothetical protein